MALARVAMALALGRVATALALAAMAFALARVATALARVAMNLALARVITAFVLALSAWIFLMSDFSFKNPFRQKSLTYWDSGKQAEGDKSLQLATQQSIRKCQLIPQLAT